MVINSYEKSPFEIRDSTGKEFKEIHDSQGRFLFKNWNDIQGSLPLTFKSYADYLKDYRIYGNTVQDGTPTPENPVEVQGCGEYYAELNGYKIPVTVSDGTNSITTPVYIGSEPLHKIGDYADYVDFKRGVVVRRIKKLVLMGREKWYTSSKYLGAVYAYYLQFSGIKPSTPIICSHLIDTTDSNYRQGSCKNDTNSVGLWMFDTTQSPTAFNRYLAAQYSAGTPVTVWYILDTPEEEPLENLLPIQTIRGTNILTVDTAVQPSEMYIKYRR